MASLLPFAFPRVGGLFTQSGPRQAQAVLSFFADRPFLDVTGKLPEYRPAKGARGGDAAGRLSEIDWRRLKPF